MCRSLPEAEFGIQSLELTYPSPWHYLSFAYSPLLDLFIQFCAACDLNVFYLRRVAHVYVPSLP